jgi:hypothetical protein
MLPFFTDASLVFVFFCLTGRSLRERSLRYALQKLRLSAPAGKTPFPSKYLHIVVSVNPSDTKA